MPEFCLGCKNCFFKGEAFCPHIDKVGVIWNSLLQSDLIVVAYPVYAMRVPGSLKTLMDHLCRHWMVHRPDEKMFYKKVVILTNSVGVGFQQKAAIKDIKTSFSWIGVSKIYHSSAGMMGDIMLDKIKPKSVNKLQNKANRVYKKAKINRAVKRMSMLTKTKFFLCKKMHAAILKTEETPSIDNVHYIERGRIKDKRKTRGSETEK